MNRRSLFSFLAGIPAVALLPLVARNGAPIEKFGNYRRQFIGFDDHGIGMYRRWWSSRMELLDYYKEFECDFNL